MDKPVAREIATLISADDAGAWFDEWSIRPGDSIPGEVQAGVADLPSSRSAHDAFGIAGKISSNGLTDAAVGPPPILNQIVRASATWISAGLGTVHGSILGRYRWSCLGGHRISTPKVG